MNKKILFGLIAVIATYAIVSSFGNRPQMQFKQWVSKHAKIYPGDQYVYRLNIFKKSQNKVAEHNKRAKQGLQSYTMAINQFSAMTDQQFQATYLLSRIQENPSNYQCTGAQPVVKDMPQSLDWSAKSAVSSVRKISGCSTGSYAIAAAETIQSGQYISTGVLVPSSPQQIIDCSTSSGNKGCTSGTVLNSYDYIYKNGVASEKSYPFKDSAQACKYSVDQKQWEIIGCTKVTPKNQQLIRAAVFRQPVAASINLSNKLKDYSQGVFQQTGLVKCKTDPNYWMVIVGYGVDDKTKKKYWKVKNSFGSGWGQQGYLYIVRTGNDEGECGIQNQIYYPID